MTDALTTIVDLRAFVAAEHELGSPAARVAERFAEYLDHAEEGETMEESFGLKPGRGESPWWKLEKRERERIAAQALVFEYGNVRAALKAAKRYFGGRGKRAGVDAVYEDVKTQAAHDYVAVAGNVPDSERTLRRLLPDRK